MTFDQERVPRGSGAADAALRELAVLLESLGGGDDEPAGPFTDFGQFGADKLDLRVFDQDTWWVDRHGQPHRLDEMSETYRANVIGFLRAGALAYHSAVVLRTMLEIVDSLFSGTPHGEVLTMEAGGSTIVEVDATAWLESTPLMRRLRALNAGVASR